MSGLPPPFTSFTCILLCVLVMFKKCTGKNLPLLKVFFLTLLLSIFLMFSQQILAVSVSSDASANMICQQSLEICILPCQMHIHIPPRYAVAKKTIRATPTWYDGYMDSANGQIATGLGNPTPLRTCQIPFQSLLPIHQCWPYHPHSRYMESGNMLYPGRNPDSWLIRSLSAVLPIINFPIYSP